MTTSADGSFETYVYALIGAVLDRLCVPFLMLDADARILFVSPVAETILKDGRHIARHDLGGLICRSEQAETLIRQFLADMRPDDDVDILLPGQAGVAPLFASLATFQAPQFHGGPTLPPVVVVFIRKGEGAEGIEVARMLYQLSEAETGAVRAVVAGTSLKQHAETRKVSVHTARKQLNAALRKTGVSSQLQLQTLIGELTRGPG